MTTKRTVRPIQVVNTVLFALFGLAITFVAWIAVTRHARAEDAPKHPTVGQLITAAQALGSLDMVPTGQLDASGKQLMAPSHYKFSGPTRLLMLKYIELGTSTLKTFQEAVKKLQEQYADRSAESQAAFEAEREKVWDSQSNVNLNPMSLDDLCLEAKPPECPQQNDIPLGTLNLLLPITK